MRSILIVDDNADLLRAYQVVLESAGFQVLAATSPDEAFKLISDGKIFDAVIVDYSMPVTSGPELLTKMIAARPELRSSKTAVLTSFPPDSPQAVELEQAGLIYIEKPMDVFEFAPEVERLFADSKPATNPPC